MQSAEQNGYDMNKLRCDHLATSTRVRCFWGGLNPEPPQKIRWAWSDAWSFESSTFGMCKAGHSYSGLNIYLGPKSKPHLTSPNWSGICCGRPDDHPFREQRCEFMWYDPHWLSQTRLNVTHIKRIINVFKHHLPHLHTSTVFEAGSKSLSRTTTKKINPLCLDAFDTDFAALQIQMREGSINLQHLSQLLAE